MKLKKILNNIPFKGIHDNREILRGGDYNSMNSESMGISYVYQQSDYDSPGTGFRMVLPAEQFLLEWKCEINPCYSSSCSGYSINLCSE